MVQHQHRSHSQHLRLESLARREELGPLSDDGLALYVGAWEPPVVGCGASGGVKVGGVEVGGRP